MPTTPKSRSTDLTEKDVASMLGTTEKEVRKLTKTGQLVSFYEKNGHYRYLTMDVQRYLNR